jgi:hypothetical protein
MNIFLTKPENRIEQIEVEPKTLLKNLNHHGKDHFALLCKFIFLFFTLNVLIFVKIKPQIHSIKIPNSYEFKFFLL